jgi:hypothetical protein
VDAIVLGVFGIIESCSSFNNMTSYSNYKVARMRAYARFSLVASS